MESDTQKITEGVREAPAASQDRCGGQKTQPDKRGATSAAGCPGCIDCEPRYTVELTTEGWQIRDNISDQIFPDVWGTKIYAKQAAQRMNVADTAEGQGRR